MLFNIPTAGSLGTEWLTNILVGNLQVQFHFLKVPPLIRNYSLNDANGSQPKSCQTLSWSYLEDLLTGLVPLLLGGAPASL